MARLKPNTRKIKSLDEANNAIMDIAQLEIQLENIDAQATEHITTAKKDAASQGEPMRTRIAELSHMIGAYAEYNKDDLFKDKKTIQVPAGEFGYRKSTSISIKKTTIELLKKLGLGRHLTIKETPNKDTMRDLDDATLTQVDAIKKTEDKFFVEADREQINKDILTRELAS